MRFILAKQGCDSCPSHEGLLIHLTAYSSNGISTLCIFDILTEPAEHGDILTS
jgi:hypothetical protein